MQMQGVKLLASGINMSKNQNVIIATGGHYHIYNRGVDKREVFLDDEDFWKLFDCLRDLNNETYYEERLAVLGLDPRSCKELNSLQFKELGNFIQNQDKLVEIISYSLNPNHFHLILKQLKDRGVSVFMQRVGTSYTNYFNKKYERSGALFQGTFKKVHIDNENYLLWLIGYVNGNIEIHGLGKAADYPWSSYQAICKELNSLHSLSKLSALSGLEDIVLPQFKNESEFRNFVEQVIRESRAKKEMKKYLLE